MSIERKLLDTRRLFLFDEIDSESAFYVVTSLKYLTDINLSPIYIYINSPGGETPAQDSIIDEMQGCIERGVDLHTIVQGEAVSAAADILAMGKPGFRFATPNSSIMLHPLSYEVNTDYADQQEKMAAFFKQKNEIYAKNLSKVCRKTIKKLTEDIDKGLWLTAQAAIKYGVIDGLWQWGWENDIAKTNQHSEDDTDNDD